MAGLLRSGRRPVGGYSHLFPASKSPVFMELRGTGSFAPEQRYKSNLLVASAQPIPYGGTIRFVRGPYRGPFWGSQRLAAKPISAAAFILSTCTRENPPALVAQSLLGLAPQNGRHRDSGLTGRISGMGLTVIARKPTLAVVCEAIQNPRRESGAACATPDHYWGVCPMQFYELSDEAKSHVLQILTMNLHFLNLSSEPQQHSICQTRADK